MPAGYKKVVTVLHHLFLFFSFSFLNTFKCLATREDKMFHRACLIWELSSEVPTLSYIILYAARCFVWTKGRPGLASILLPQSLVMDFRTCFWAHAVASAAECSVLKCSASCGPENSSHSIIVSNTDARAHISFFSRFSESFSNAQLFQFFVVSIT